jgi:hypothetical protein
VIPDEHELVHDNHPSSLGMGKLMWLAILIALVVMFVHCIGRHVCHVRLMSWYATEERDRTYELYCQTKDMGSSLKQKQLGHHYISAFDKDTRTHPWCEVCIWTSVYSLIESMQKHLLMSSSPFHSLCRERSWRTCFMPLARKGYLQDYMSSDYESIH